MNNVISRTGTYVGYILLTLFLISSMLIIGARVTNWYNVSGGTSFSENHFRIELRMWRCTEVDPDPELRGTRCRGISINQDGIARTLSHGGQAN